MSRAARKAKDGGSGSENGSIALFVLFVCVGVAVLVQTLSVVVVCANRAVGAEDSGRLVMEQKDEALAVLRQRALLAWGTMPSSVIQPTPDEVRGSLAELADSGGWALAASAWHAPDVSPIVVSAWLERGRDGVDLPSAGLVAATASWTSGRVSPWLEGDGGEAAGTEGTPGPADAVARFWTVPAAPLIGPGVSIKGMASAWRLDDGWRSFFEADATDGLAPGPRVAIIRGGPGTTLQVPQGWGGSPDDPCLLVVMGGASLDARGRGDLFGVIVVNDGDALLDGTRLHGALFATGDVDFGTTGLVAFSRSILRWATDRSLNRARLVPGTRQETLS